MKRGEVWLVNLEPAVGAEIRKTRPAVIVSNDSLGALPLKIIVPITGWNEKFTQADWHIKITAGPVNGLAKDSSADTFQVRSVSQARLIRKLGELSPEMIGLIDRGLAISLAID